MVKRLGLFLFMFLILVLGTRVKVTGAEGVISLPWTGQSKCYNTSGTEISCHGTGQDGELQTGVDWPNPRFTVSGECVTDNLTGLMWAKHGNLPNGTVTWQGALDYVASMNSGSGLCGYQDWRLPNVNELESLANTGEADTATWLISQGFSNVQPDTYWSSSTYATYTNNAWNVYMGVGSVIFGYKATNRYVWPVRFEQSGSLGPSALWRTGQTTSYAYGDDGDLEKGVAWPSPRFTDHGDGTVTDNLTGLMWTKNANHAAGTKTWQGALDYVKTLNIGGYTDWGLPNRKELFSLIDRSENTPSLPANSPFKKVQPWYYWSSTADAYNTNFAWVVGVWNGGVISSNKSLSLCVWPVRSGQGALGYPVISVTPNPVEFGNVYVGATVDEQITVRNHGNANLDIGTISSPSEPFSKVTDNCSGQTIPSGGSCTVSYRFAAISASSYSSNSNIPSNDPVRNPITVTLTGTGTSNSPIGPDLTGEWISLFPRCKKTGKCELKGTLKLQNIGSTDVSQASVHVYLSDNDTLDAADTFLKALRTGKVKAGGFKLKKFKAKLPKGETELNKYIIVVIDEGNLVQEIDETNNIKLCGPIPWVFF